MRLDVPDWFGRVGTVPDDDIASEEGVPRPTVTVVRRALGIRPYTQTKADDHTWAAIQEMTLSGVPRHMWATELGFKPMGRFTAEACMDEWIYCYERDLEYDMERPRIAVPKPMDVRPRSKYKITRAQKLDVLDP